MIKCKNKCKKKILTLRPIGIVFEWDVAHLLAQKWTVCGRWKQCVRLRHHKEKLSHTHFILHQRIEKRPYCMWLCIPEGKPIWQVKSLQRGEPIPEQWTKQNHPDESKRHGRVKSHWQENLNWQDFKTGKRTFKNIFQFGSHSVHLTMEMGPIRSRFRVSQTRANRKTQIIWCPTSYCIYLKLNSASHLSPGDATSIWSSTKPSPLFSYCPFCYCTR